MDNGRIYIDGRIVNLKQNTCPLRIVKKRWYHKVMDFMTLPPGKHAYLCTIKINVDLCCNKSGTIFIKRR